MKIGDKARLTVKTMSGTKDVKAEVKKHPSQYGNGMVVCLNGFDIFASGIDIRYSQGVAPRPLGEWLAEYIKDRWGFEVYSVEVVG